MGGVSIKHLFVGRGKWDDSLFTAPDVPKLWNNAMTSQCYPQEFIDDAFRQVPERGYTVAEVSRRLGASAQSSDKQVKARITKGKQSAAAVIQESLYTPVFSRPRLKRVEFYNPVKSSHITALTGG
jgi:hypothetical protein